MIGSILRMLLSGLRTLWLWLGLSLVLVLLINALLDALLADPAGLAVIDPAARPPAREHSDSFADPAWAASWFAESEAARHSEWRSYVYFRRKPFAGTHIHVDAHGFRQTPVTAGPALQVWLFGGSLVWGTGVDDDQTLAAVLQRELQRELGTPVHVHNFGESGYVSQQSLLAFAGALRCAGPPPQLALFLDGANDVYAALQAGRAGLPQNEQNRVVEFNLSRRFDRVLLAWAARLKGVAKLVSRPEVKIDPAVLGAEVARSYLTTAQQIQALAAARQVPTVLFWQPTLFDKARRSPDEQAMHGASLAVHAQLQQFTRAGLDGSVQDLAKVFANQSQPRYFDFVHLNAAGIEELARAMLPQALAGLRSASVDAGVDGFGLPAGPPAADRGRCIERPMASP